MVSGRQTLMRRIWVVIILFTMVLVPAVGISDLPVQAVEEPQVAPINPDFLEFWESPPEPFYGYIPPPMDLSHLEEIPVERPITRGILPSSFDWRDTGKVTSVKDQNPCGTCWVHGTLAAVESKVLIEESVSPQPDYSEQNLACCTDPAWAYLVGNRCMGGGWAWLAADTLSKKGTRLETCQPYDTDTINAEACDDGCQSIKRITDYRMIANQATDPSVIVPIKNAVYNHGPLAMSYHADDGSHMYVGSIYYWPDCPENANHLVCIIGWDDNIEWPGGAGSGAWIVKNSWGTGWEDGDNGYFYLCYGSASMCEVASFDYKDYDPGEQIYYWDEAGQVAGLGDWDDYCGWMANVFTSTQDGDLTHVDFWTTSNNAEYEIYVYLDGDISDGLQNQSTSQSGTCQEFGYYSIPLSSPVSLTNGQPFTIAVKMTTPGYRYPLPVECQYIQGETTIVDPTIQTGKSFYRHGDGDSWSDTAGEGCNACLRARVTSGAAGEPDITVDPTSFEVTLCPDTTWDDTLTIGNVGTGDLSYNITDYETTGFTAPREVEVPKLRGGEGEGPIELVELSPSEPISFAAPPPMGGGVGEEIAYDDGTADNAWVWTLAGGEFAVRFTPSSYPVALQTARICLVDSALFDPDWPDSDHEQFAVKVYDDDGAGGEPGTCLGSVNTTADNWGWWDVDISGLGVTITEGDFYIAYRQLSDPPDCEALCADETAPDGRSWAYNAVSWSRVEDTGTGPLDWMIRCVVGEADCSWLAESPTSGTVAPDGSDDITVTIDTSGLAAGDYSADIYVSSNDPDENPKTVSVTLHVGLMEGDASLNGCVSIADALLIVQYKVGLKTLTADQLKCADTTDEGAVSMADPLHIVQWLVDPEGTFGVLAKPLWESPADNDMLPPQKC